MEMFLVILDCAMPFMILEDNSDCTVLLVIKLVTGKKKEQVVPNL